MATFIFVHGAGDAGWSWRLVADELRARGHAALAPDLPCEDDAARFGDYADVVAAAARGAEGPLVVVAHSLGGFTAPLVCGRADVALLVLASAMIPRPGEPASAWWEASGYLAATGDVEASDVEAFLHDVEPALAAEALARGRDQSGAPMAEPWPLPAWPDVPTRAIVFRDDRFFPAAFMRAHVRERLGIEADETPGSHAAMLSRPAELAERLLAQLAHAR